MTDNLILILDIETTNFLNKGGKIVELGAADLNLETGEIRKVFDEMTHETGITKKEAEESWIVNNSSMTVDDIRFSKNLDYIKPHFQDVIDCYPLGATAFNNVFDFGFLESRGFTFPKKLGCPMKLSTNICQLPKKRGGGYKWPSVEEAHKHFFGDVGYVEQHRGADDAMHEAQIVYKLYQMGIFKLD